MNCCCCTGTSGRVLCVQPWNQARTHALLSVGLGKQFRRGCEMPRENRKRREHSGYMDVCYMDFRRLDYFKKMG